MTYIHAPDPFPWIVLAYFAGFLIALAVKLARDDARDWREFLGEDDA